MKYLFLFLLLIPLRAQIKEFEPGDFIQNLTGGNYNEFMLEEIEELFNHKIDLNNLSVNDYSKLFFIDEEVLRKIINYRSKTGLFISVNDLYRIPDINPNSINSLLPFVKIEDKTTNLNLQNYLPNLNCRIRSVRNSVNRDLYARYIFSSEYFEFSSIHKNISNKFKTKIINYSIKLKVNNNIPEIIAGYYSVKFGFGLALWGPYRIFKGVYYDSFRKSNSKFRPYRSSINKNNLFGMGVKLDLGNFSLQLFNSSLDESSFLFDLNSSQLQGGIFSYKPDNFEAEILYLRNIDNNENILSTSIKYQNEKIRYENEVNYKSGFISHINTLTYSPSGNTKIFYSIRNYNHNSFNDYSNPIRESAHLADETGQILCLELKNKKCGILLYLDKYRTKSGIINNLSFNGLEIAAIVSIIPNKIFQFKNTLSIDKKERLEKNEGLLYGDKFKVKSELFFYFHKQFEYSQRIDFVKTNFSDISYSLTSRIKYNFLKHCILFASISYYNVSQHNDIYLYENDLPGLFVNRKLTNRGVFYYLMIKLNINSDLLFSIKYSNMELEDNYYLDKINEYKETLKFQLDLKI